jgi:hypothetical protein
LGSLSDELVVELNKNLASGHFHMGIPMVKRNPKIVYSYRFHRVSPGGVPIVGSGRLDCHQEKWRHMKNRFAVGGVVVGLTLGGAIGVAFGAPGVSGAQTTPTTIVAPATTVDAPDTPGVDDSNKDAAHEAAETPEQAAAEAAGKHHGGKHHGGADGKGGSNEDAAHEAAESPEREAAEDAAKAAGATAPAATPATTVAGNA